MTKQELFAWTEARSKRLLDQSRAKNADYTGIADDPFANFTIVEKIGICSTEEGFLVRMMDKLMRINSFVQKGVLEVKDEKIDDTLGDLRVYADLLTAYIETKKKKGQMIEINIQTPEQAIELTAERCGLNLTDLAGNIRGPR